VIIGQSLRELREAKNLSREDIESRAGLFPYDVSRIENGDTVPTIETLEKLAQALEVPVYRLFYNGEDPPHLPNLPGRLTAEDIAGVRTSGRPRKKSAEASGKSDNRLGGGSARR